MLIAIDIGNTRIKAGKFVEDNLTEFHFFNNIADVLIFLKSEFQTKLDSSTYEKTNIAISSVVPDKTKIISEEVYKITGKSPFIISKDIKTNLTISYKTPETLGIDRFCSTEGAFFLFKSSEKYKNYNAGTYILSIDFGTTTTINVVEYPGNFIGGLIAPGLEMMFESLNQKTAQLPYLSVNDFKSAIGNDTNSSIASGVVTSVVGMIEKTISHFEPKAHQPLAEKLEIPVGTKLAFSLQNVFVYVTGGNAKKIIPHLKFDFIYEEGLVLYGINALNNMNKTI